MSVTKKTYPIGKIKQLIDLNGDSINFDIEFKITSKNKEPFDILVVDQTTLDNSPNLEYKKADKGEISGNIVHNKNVYQNYFIIVKADNPCECDVEIVKKELPKTVDIPKSSLPKKSNDSFNYINIFLIVGVVVLISIGFYMFYRRSDTRSNVESVGSPRRSHVESVGSPRRSHVESVGSPRQLHVELPKSSVVQSSLLDRLKNLKM